LITTMKFITINPDAYVDMRKGLTFEALGFWLDLVTCCNGHDSLPNDDHAIGAMLGTDVRVVRRLKRELVKAGVVKPRLGVNGGAS
jgi:hypothetical protein